MGILIAGKRVEGLRLRQTRGGTPDVALALATRGKGGSILSIGGNRVEMMSHHDVSLAEVERFRLVAMRQPVTLQIKEVAEVAPTAATAKVLPEMVTIPKGKFTMGSTENGAEQPVREVTITKDFELGKHPVTNAEYKAFCEATARDIPALATETILARHPVVNVSWKDAATYCKWAGGRLATEAEWEYAARGSEGREYPYGNTFDVSKCNFNSQGTTSVDSYPDGASPFGVMGMSGNVWEWVNDWYADEYNPNDVTDPTGPNSGNSRDLRGGSWYTYFSSYLRGAYRHNDIPKKRSNIVGFRLARTLP